MKLTLDQADIFRLLKTGLEIEGRLTVPDESQGTMELLQDEDGFLAISLEVTFGTAEIVLMGSKNRGSMRGSDPRDRPMSRSEMDPRTQPIPAPEPMNEPSYKEMHELVAQSENLEKQKKDPKQYIPARNRFPSVKTAANIEDFGKDPSDISDEIT